MPYDYAAVRVAKYNLCAHIYELVDEEESTLEHLLVNKYRSARLSCNHDEHRKQVGRESGPRRIGKSHDRAVEKRVDNIVRLVRNVEIVAVYVNLHAEPVEGVWNNAELSHGTVLYAYAVAHHCRHTDERSHLNHVGQYAVFGAVQLAYAVDVQEVGGDARNLGAHSVEHRAELLYIRLAGGVVYRCLALCENGSHDDVGSAGHGCLVEKHVCAVQFLRFYIIYVALVVGIERCAEVLEAEEVGVETSTSYLVAARFSHYSLAKASEQRTHHKHTAAKRRALAYVFVAGEEVEVEFVCLERKVALAVARHFHAHVLQQAYEVVDIEDVGDVGYSDGVGREQHSGYHFESLVLGSLRRDGALQLVSAFNYKRFHKRCGLCSTTLCGIYLQRCGFIFCDVVFSRNCVSVSLCGRT